MSESTFLEQRYTVEEVFKLYDFARNANTSWIADTAENKRRCVEVLSAYLDRVPPPAPPTFPDLDLSVSLADGSMPLPLDATTYQQRRATIAQQRNLVARLRKFTAWQREQQRSG